MCPNPLCPDPIDDEQHSVLILSTYKNDFFDNKDPVLMDFSGKTHETLAFEYDDATEVYASCGVFYQDRVKALTALLT